MRNIEQHFADVGLRCRLQKRPIVNANHDIVQMDIRTRKGKEEFLIWPGHEDNQIHVLGKDKSFQQLVLFVKEPVREFTVTTHFGRTDPRDRKGALQDFMEMQRLRPSDVVSVNMDQRLISYRAKTVEGKRRFLTGMDECHYFMTQMTQPVSTVREAHDALRAPSLNSGDKFKRQGEWFFTEAKNLTAEDIRMGIIRKKRHIGDRGGNPHVADEVLFLKDGRMFVRGRVRHVDHKTKKFSQWMLVRGNTETSVSRGATWID